MFQYFFRISSILLFKNCLYFSDQKYLFQRSWYNFYCLFTAVVDIADSFIIEFYSSVTVCITFLGDTDSTSDPRDQTYSKTFFILLWTALSVGLALAKISNIQQQALSIAQAFQFLIFFFEGVTTLFEFVLPSLECKLFLLLSKDFFIYIWNSLSVTSFFGGCGGMPVWCQCRSSIELSLLFHLLIMACIFLLLSLLYLTIVNFKDKQIVAIVIKIWNYE